MRWSTFLLVHILVMFGCLSASGQDCDSLLKKANSYQRAGKEDAAEKYYNMVKDNACDEKHKKKAEDKLRPMMAAKMKPTKATTLTITPDSDVVIPYYGGEYALKVSGANSWKVDIESDWCEVRKEGRVIVIKCPEENTSMQKRIANVIVTSGSRSKTIVVTNEGAPEMLRSTVGNINFSSRGASDMVDVYSNTSWKLDSVPQWVSAVKKENQIELKVDANRQSVERFGNVVISTPSSASVIIKIYQGAGNEHLYFSKNNLTFGPQGGDEYVRVHTDAEVWRMGDFPSWCQVTRVNDDSLKIHCTPNDPLDLIREGSVNVTTGFQTLGINIFQEAKPYPYMVPSMGIGGRSLSFGVNVGYIHPIISTSSSGNFIGSVVNYSLGNNNETASYAVSGGFTFGIFADIRLYRNIYLIAGVNYLQYSYKNEFKSDVYRIIPQDIYFNDQATPYYLKGNTQNDYKEEYKISQIELPILVSYRFPVTKKNHVQVNAGPVFNYGLNAKMRVKGFTSSESSYYYAIENGRMTDNLYDKRIQSIQDKGTGEFDLYDEHVEYSERNKYGQSFDKSKNLNASPLKRLNVGARLGVVYEYYGFSIGAEYTFMFTNMANSKYWDGNRWEIFEHNSAVQTQMLSYKQCNHYLGIKFGYTFRY